MKKQLALAIALAAASFGTLAGELSYNYIEGGYVRTDINNLGDGDGFAVNGSVALGEQFHLFGGYSMQDASESGVDIDLDALRIGAGWNHALGERVDFIARAAYERSETDASVAGFGSIDGETDGYSIEAGFRGLTSLDGDIEGWILGGYADALATLAYCEQRLGRQREAQEHSAAALVLDPTNALARQVLRGSAVVSDR